MPGRQAVLDRRARRHAPRPAVSGARHPTTSARLSASRAATGLLQWATRSVRQCESPLSQCANRGTRNLAGTCTWCFAGVALVMASWLDFALLCEASKRKPPGRRNGAFRLPAGRAEKRLTDREGVRRAAERLAVARLVSALASRSSVRSTRRHRTTGAPRRRAAIAPSDGWRSGSGVGRSECCLDRGRGAVSIGPMNSLWASRRIVATAAGAPLAALAIAACGGGSDTPRPPKTASGRPATIGLEPAGSLGKVLVDSRGRTVYLFRKDSRGKSSCAAACAAAWPPVRAHGTPVPAPRLSAAKLTTTPRSDGAPQVLYNGHPLYRYAGDAKPGDTNGQRVTAFGAAWFAVSGAGQVVSGPASKPGGGRIY